MTDAARAKDEIAAMIGRYIRAGGGDDALLAEAIYENFVVRHAAEQTAALRAALKEIVRADGYEGSRRESLVTGIAKRALLAASEGMDHGGRCRSHGRAACTVCAP